MSHALRTTSYCVDEGSMQHRIEVVRIGRDLVAKSTGERVRRADPVHVEGATYWPLVSARTLSRRCPKLCRQMIDEFVRRAKVTQ